MALRPGAPFAATVYDVSQTAWRPLANTLKIMTTVACYVTGISCVLVYVVCAMTLSERSWPTARRSEAT